MADASSDEEEFACVNAGRQQRRLKLLHQKRPASSTPSAGKRPKTPAPRPPAAAPRSSLTPAAGQGAGASSFTAAAAATLHNQQQQRAGWQRQDHDGQHQELGVDWLADDGGGQGPLQLAADAAATANCSWQQLPERPAGSDRSSRVCSPGSCSACPVCGCLLADMSATDTGRQAHVNACLDAAGSAWLTAPAAAAAAAAAGSRVDAAPAAAAASDAGNLAAAAATPGEPPAEDGGLREW